jgi:hypothetical protein
MEKPGKDSLRWRRNWGFKIFFDQPSGMGYYER